MSIEENKALANRWMKEIWQEANPASMDELLSPDFFFNYAPSGVEPNREAYKQGINSFHVGFPDIKWTSEDIIAEGDKVAVHWKGQGTHKGEFWGVPPTGERVTVGGISIIHIEGSKIVEEWGYIDIMGLMEQLGALSPPE
ncbi:MAG: hypothetical protein AYK19_17980 [Theionarchaea archaeon DG-70-1]|nr:MAG: hypothetical protein AYK19_17980 [Theionarchaea archaeon DG-70-1]